MADRVLGISKNLSTLLSEFSGAHGKTEKERTDSLKPAFEQIAGKLLYGGHFIVTEENGDVVRNVYLHNVEFYYHEEGDGLVKDYIVYHRNPENPAKTPNPLPPFPIGSLHTHVSGIDITFEDNRHPDKPKYRASVLVRAFRVEVVKETEGLSFSMDVDERSTSFYNALFMGVNVLDRKLSVHWHDNGVKQCEIPQCKPRHNVGKFDEKIHKKGYKYHVKKEKFEQDERLWAFFR